MKFIYSFFYKRFLINLFKENLIVDDRLWMSLFWDHVIQRKLTWSVWFKLKYPRRKVFQYDNVKSLETKVTSVVKSTHVTVDFTGRRA